MSGRIISIELRILIVLYVRLFPARWPSYIQTRSKFYDDFNSIGVKGAHFLGGDMNARIHHRFHSEQDVLGPHVFGSGVNYLSDVADLTLETKALRVSCCQLRSLNILNTFFQKQPVHHCAIRENTTERGPVWSLTRYVQFYFLVGCSVGPGRS